MDATDSGPIDVLFVGHRANNEIDHILITDFLGDKAQVRFAESYEMVEDAFEKQPPDVTICEAELRGVDVRKICDDLVNKACVFISSRDRDSERRKCMLQVRECYLTRPYSREQLLKAVTTAHLSPPQA